MNTIIALFMAASIATSPMAACPEKTTHRWWSFGTDTVDVREETSWPLGETVAKEYTITYDEWQGLH